MDTLHKEQPKERASRLRFNFGFLIEAASGTSREIEIDYPHIWLADDLELTALAGTFNAIRNSKGIYVTGRLFTTYLTECARCLDDVKLALAVQLNDLFYYPAISAPPGDFGVGEDGFIDLAPLVRELILLEVPMQPFCEADCKGLCPECGSNQNHGVCGCEQDQIDPRFLPLQNLLDSSDNKQG